MPRLTTLFCLVLLLCGAAPTRAAERPNLVLIYADDLGYGDVSCYGATAVKTPNVDRLAQEGLRFTDAHAPSATCTPSRYAMLTGEYAWRKPGTSILPGDARLIIEPGRATLASILQRAGYKTGVVGKWHLGLSSGHPDWNGQIQPGPLEIGFDYSFLIPATGDRVPCVYVENHRVVGLDPNDPLKVSYVEPVGSDPTGLGNPELLKMRPSQGHNQTIVNGVSRIGYMSGGQAARWVDEDMADVITKKAADFIERHKGGPFFLYFAPHDIHVPRLPNQRFVGRTPLGPRGDVIAEMDWSTGEILKTLDRLGLAENTLVIFTSDNGGVVDDGYQDDAVAKLGSHKPNGPLRGGKYSAFEAATRVPWIVRWPTRVKPGVSDALVCQIDFPSTFAALTGQELKADDAPDSFNLLEALTGRSQQGRQTLVEHADALSLREAQWKYIEPMNKGAGRAPVKVTPNTRIETGFSNEPQLYNLAADLGETKNLAADHPDRVRRMQAALDKIRGDGRSRPAGTP